MRSRIVTSLSSLFFLLVSACGAVRNGEFAGKDPAPEGSPTSPEAIRSIWQDMGSRRWSRVSTMPAGTIWQALTASLDNVDPVVALEGGEGVEFAMGTLDGVPNLVFVVLGGSGSMRLAPVGPAGGSVYLTPGAHVLQRWCTPAQPNNFAEIAPVNLLINQGAPAGTMQDLDPFLATCGLAYAPALDLGTKVAALPRGGEVESLPVTDLAWAPTSDAVVLLAGSIFRHDVEVMKYVSGASSLVEIAKGDYCLPLEVGAGGRVLVNEVTWPGELRSDASNVSVQRLSLQGPGSAAAILPVGSIWPVGSKPLDFLTPDGTTLAFGRTNARIDIVDLASNRAVPTSFGNGFPLAWDPSGQKLLVSSGTQVWWMGLDGSQGPAISFPVDRRFLPRNGGQDRVFWGASGPKLLRQDGNGTQSVDVQTGSSLRFVEPDWVAAPGATLGFAAATEQVFAWAVQCLGLGETACTSELRRLTIATGTVDVVARADGSLIFAVSPDGRQLALVHDDGLYLKQLVP
jgi:hypothetical protein